jgi:hypothetical protein
MKKTLEVIEIDYNDGYNPHLDEEYNYESNEKRFINRLYKN